MRFSLPAAALLFLSSHLHGASVSGRIVDGGGTPVPYANVALFSMDSVLVKGVASTSDGSFALEAHPGTYYVRITFLAMADQFVPLFKLTSTGKDLGTIILKPKVQNLNEMEVTAERTEMELKLDKRIFNIGSDVTNKGATAADVLDNIPSVDVDVDGNVSLRGSENVRILIDGKPSGLTGLRSSDALRLLQGDMVERIEIITNPSARYDAEGEAGIINIILKKEKRKGFNASLTATTGYPDNHGASAALNWRRKHINFFTTASGRYRMGPGGGSTHTDFVYGDTSFSYDEKRSHLRGGPSGTFNAGVDLILSPLSTLTISGLYGGGLDMDQASVEYDDIDSEGAIVRHVERTEDESGASRNTELQLYFDKKFKKKRQLTIQGKWSDSDEHELAEIHEFSDYADLVAQNDRTMNAQKEQRWYFQQDYLHPFGQEGQFECGTKAQLRHLDYDYDTESQSQSGDWAPVALYDDHLLYDENIFAAYVMAGDKKGAWSYQTGLRVEYSDVTTNLIQSDTLNHRSYADFFPSVHLSYSIRENDEIQLSYSRRLRRPHFWWLLPFFGYANSRNLFFGNPNLDPEYAHSGELGYLKKWASGSLLSSLYYRHTDGAIQRISISDSSGVTIRFPVNLGTEDNLGIELSQSQQWGPWWSSQLGFNYYRSIEQGNYEGQDFDSDTWAWKLTASSKWRIVKKLSLQSSFHYRSRKTSIQGERLPSYSLDAGCSLDMLKGKGTLTLNARDILNSRKHHSFTYADTFTSERVFQWRSRQLTLSFNYRINQKKKRGRQMMDGGFEDLEM